MAVERLTLWAGVDPAGEEELNIIYDSQAHELLLPYFVIKKAIVTCPTEKPDNWFDSPHGETLQISQTSEHDFP